MKSEIFGLSLIILILALATLVLTDSCGGNCLSGNNCPICYCGNNQSYILDLNQYCQNPYWSWSPSCCKCIASHSSSANSNSISYIGRPRVGLFQITQSFLGTCSLPNATYFCNVNANVECAYKIYNLTKSWSEFPAAKECGC